MARKQRITVGGFFLVRQKRPELQWVEGDVSSRYFPAWRVKLSLPGGVQRMLSSALGICPKCLAVPADKTPTKERPSCGCQVEARRFGQAALEAELAVWHDERMTALGSWRLRSAGVTNAKVRETYEANVPMSGRKNYLKNVSRWWSIMEEALGRDPGPLSPSVLTWELALDWIQMRQEFYRRGWSRRGGVPADIADPWAVLRAELKAKRLPPIDKASVSEGNTTIKGYINAARAVLGPTSRSEYLRGIELPDLSSFMEGKIKLPSPKGHREIEPDHYHAMYEAAPALAAEDPALWVVLQMLWRFGCRPIEVWHATPDWIEHDAEGPIFVLKNRPEQGFVISEEDEEEKPFGFALKARDRAIERRLRIAPDLWKVMQGIQTAGSLVGAGSRTAAQRLVERSANEWVRRFLPRATYGQHGVYLLRHYVGRLVARRHGVTMASLWLGHATEATLQGRRATITETTYASGAGTDVLPALTWEDLQPEG